MSEDWHLYSNREYSETYCGETHEPPQEETEAPVPDEGSRWTLADLRLLRGMRDVGLRRDLQHRLILDDWCQDCMEHPEVQMMILETTDLGEERPQSGIIEEEVEFVPINVIDQIEVAAQIPVNYRKND